LLGEVALLAGTYQRIFCEALQGAAWAPGLFKAVFVIQLSVSVEEDFLPETI